MTDKVQKIREDVEKLHGNPYYMMAVKDVLEILDMQEEPVRRTSADIESAMQEVEEKSKAFTEAHKGESSDEILAGMRGEEPIIGILSRYLDHASKEEAMEVKSAIDKWFSECFPEPVSEDLGEYINELSKQFPEVSFAKLSRITVRVAKWQKDRMIGNTTDARCFGFQGAALFSFRLPADNYLVGSEVKVIVIKED